MQKGCGDEMEYSITEHKEDKYIVRIHRPILTAEEREARLQDVKSALMEFGRERRDRK